MADYMAAEIWIGGKMPASLASELCKAIADDYVSLAWGDAPFRPTSPEDLLDAREPASDDDNVRLLWFCNDESRYGEFNDLEELLQEHGIAYSRRREGKYEHEPLF